MTRRPSTSSGRSIASRVVPATSETMTRSAPSEAVDQRGLADVRAPDDGEAHDVVVLLLGLVLGQQLDDAVEQVAGPEALRGRDGDGSPSPRR